MNRNTRRHFEQPFPLPAAIFALVAGLIAFLATVNTVQSANDPFAPRNEASSLSSARSAPVPSPDSLTAAERQEQIQANRQIEQGRRMIEEGRRMTQIQDGRSALDGRRIDNSSTRRSGERRMSEGQELVRHGEERLARLYRSIAEREADRDQSMAEANFRQWEDREGRKMRASYVEVKGKSVIVLRDDGREFPIPLTALSEHDTAYVELLASGHQYTTEGFLAAVDSNDVDAVRLYFAAKLTIAEPAANSALEKAIENGGRRLLESLLDSGINPSGYTSDGLRLLSEAVRRGRRDLCEVLLEAGASPADQDRTDEALTPLKWALLQGNRELVALFTEGSADQGWRLQAAIKLILDGTYTSVPQTVMTPLTALEGGEDISAEDAARVELFLAGHAATVEGLLNALGSEIDRSAVFRFCRAGIVAEAVQTEWPYLSRLLPELSDAVLEEFLACDGLPREKAAELRLLAARYEITADGLANAIANEDIQAVDDFLLAGILPTDKTRDGTSPLFYALRQNEPSIKQRLLDKSGLSSADLARLQLESVGNDIEDPDRALLELQAADVPFDESTFLEAVRNADGESVRRFIRAGAANKFDFSNRSEIWSIAISTPQELQDLLLAAAPLDHEEKLFLKIRLLDVSALENGVRSAARVRPPPSGPAARRASSKMEDPDKPKQIQQLSLAEPPLEDGLNPPPRTAASGRYPRFTFRGFHLGMRVEDAHSRFQELLSGVRNPPGEPPFRIEPITAQAQSDGVEFKLMDWSGTSYIQADSSWRVISFGLSPGIVNVLFNTAEMDVQAFAQRFIDSYDIPELKPSIDRQHWYYESTDGLHVTIGINKFVLIYRVERSFD